MLEEVKSIELYFFKGSFHFPIFSLNLFLFLFLLLLLLLLLLHFLFLHNPLSLPFISPLLPFLFSFFLFVFPSLFFLTPASLQGIFEIAEGISEISGKWTK